MKLTNKVAESLKTYPHRKGLVVENSEKTKPIRLGRLDMKEVSAEDALRAVLDVPPPVKKPAKARKPKRNKK